VIILAHIVPHLPSMINYGLLSSILRVSMGVFSLLIMVRDSASIIVDQIRNMSRFGRAGSYRRLQP
jgi:hypothetical protein